MRIEISDMCPCWQCCGLRPASYARPACDPQTLSVAQSRRSVTSALAIASGDKMAEHNVSEETGGTILEAGGTMEGDSQSLTSKRSGRTR